MRPNESIAAYDTRLRFYVWLVMIAAGVLCTFMLCATFVVTTTSFSVKLADPISEAE